MSDSYSDPEYDQICVPARPLRPDFPLIDCDPHFRRVIRYARPVDWYIATGAFAAGPTTMLIWERMSPSHAGKGAMASIMRLNVAIALTGSFFILYTRSIMRFYGACDNKREVDMDMREMVDKVKKGEPLYGKSSLSPYMQGVAARNSRYTGFLLHLIPWFNFVNHNHHGVDTAKYYRQAERELAAEDATKAAEGTAEAASAQKI